MMRTILLSALFAAALLLGPLGLPYARAQVENPTTAAPKVAELAEPTAEQIREWIEQLGSARFAIREVAMTRLIDAGPPAVAALAIELETADVEESLRGLDVLRELALQEHAGATQAEAALRQLAQGRVTASSHRATSVLKSLVVARTAKGEKRLRRLGAVISYTPETADEKSLGADTVYVTLGKSWKGKLDDLSLLNWLTDYKGIHVTFQSDKFDDTWLQKVVEVPLVISLQINRTAMTDEGVKVISGMNQLRGLTIRYCKLTDASLKHLEQLGDAMTFFSIFGSGVSREKFDALAVKRPNWNTRYGKGGFLGIGGMTFENNGITGCIVQSIQPNHAAAIAGLREFDIIIAYNGQPVSEFVPAIRPPAIIAPKNEQGPKPAGDIGEAEPKKAQPSLSELIGRNAPGDRVKVTVLRNAKEIVKEVVLGEWP